jgi:hypothetical protein
VTFREFACPLGLLTKTVGRDNHAMQVSAKGLPGALLLGSWGRECLQMYSILGGGIMLSV